MIQFFYSQLASPGENIRIRVQAKDGYSHNTTAFLELKVQLLQYVIALIQINFL